MVYNCNSIGTNNRVRKPTMLLSFDLKLFGMVPLEKRRPGIRWVFENVEVIGSPPRVFLRGTLFLILVFYVVCLFVIAFRGQFQTPYAIIGTEALFILSIILPIHAQKSERFLPVLLNYSAISVISLILNIFFPGNWGDIWLISVCGFSLYRFPKRRAWPLVALNIVMLVVTNGLFSYLFSHNSRDGSILLTLMIKVVGVCWVSFTRRTRDLLVIELQKVQVQLRAEMERTEELATVRERTRIARDMHDVLAHTLTILSVQIQAARQLVRQDSERLATKLDDMAGLLKESMAESRRVVGLLREPARTSSETDIAVPILRSLVEQWKQDHRRRAGLQSRCNCRLIRHCRYNFKEGEHERAQDSSCTG